MLYKAPHLKVSKILRPRHDATHYLLVFHLKTFHSIQNFVTHCSCYTISWHNQLFKKKKNGLGHCGVKSFKVLDPFLLQNMFILNEYEWKAYTISSAYMHVYIYKQAVLMNFNFYKHIRRNAHYQAHNKRSRKSVCNTIIFLICIQRINAFKKYL